ncbi:MAG: tRNA (adenosine(37)-N6)-dimethylallyltransferase MiaA [Candidatus Shapirobacteria bacterium]|nr:tRNA (adenosine(37)-N6)-dimethylallyltransferase MiaA [Candidatus Shapirobacteria bacterium]MDD3002925.1 tRNA (adenosine(37)-N6)-dimethylallyltransferase MiaA [Candidatus Shapirobacteria bacterium]MDD4383128.1 tRNA (adenosine(37)-N6)-dimethylallyltransferase MiaA [Candidatus Shapirobacteria bacterium]
MINKILIISGPTATGKTDLASKLAKKYNGELISTDSCQIYKGLDIGTGKDQPSETPIYLIDLINPDQKFSVAQFQKAGLEIINKLHSQNKLPILVGCSGFYLDSLINPKYNTFSIKPNKIWRIISKKLSVKTLQKIYKLLDPQNFSKLNNSDINNHYRLTRKIEIKLSKKSPSLSREGSGVGFDILHISLTAPLNLLYDRIDQRVQKRMDMGFLDEIKKILKKYSWSDPGLQIGAYQCLKPYFENKKNPPFFKGSCPQDGGVLSNCLQKWKYAEHSDARRQGTYLKSRYKDKAQFFDITSSNFKNKIFKIVSKWYNKL